jgi:hypothetical protein
MIFSNKKMMHCRTGGKIPIKRGHITGRNSSGIPFFTWGTNAAISGFSSDRVALNGLRVFIKILLVRKRKKQYFTK